MKIKAIQNFAHTSGRVFSIGIEYEVTPEHGKEFVDAGLAIEVKPPHVDDKKKTEKYVKPVEAF